MAVTSITPSPGRPIPTSGATCSLSTRERRFGKGREEKRALRRFPARRHHRRNPLNLVRDVFVPGRRFQDERGLVPFALASLLPLGPRLRIEKPRYFGATADRREIRFQFLRLQGREHFAGAGMDRPAGRDQELRRAGSRPRRADRRRRLLALDRDGHSRFRARPRARRRDARRQGPARRLETARQRLGEPGWAALPPAGHGPHHYVFTVYALPTETLGLPANTRTAFVGFTVNSKALAKATLTATYGPEIPPAAPLCH